MDLHESNNKRLTKILHVHLVDVDRFSIVNLHIQQIPLDELLSCVVIPCVQQGLMRTKSVHDGLYTPVEVRIDIQKSYVCIPLPPINVEFGCAQCWVHVYENCSVR